MMKELQDLKDAITEFEVNSTIYDDDIELWNNIIKATAILEKKLNDPAT